MEPARLRTPRDPIEATITASPAELSSAFPPGLARVLATHTRPEPMQGLLRRIDPGADRMLSLGYIGHGGTLDVFGMLFANRCTWGHIVGAAAQVLKVPISELLDPWEATAIAGKTNPRALQTSVG
jgi:phosphoketolase